MKWQKDSAALRLFAAVVVLISLFFIVFSVNPSSRLSNRTPLYKTDTYICHRSCLLSLLLFWLTLFKTDISLTQYGHINTVLNSVVA